LDNCKSTGASTTGTKPEQKDAASCEVPSKRTKTGKMKKKRKGKKCDLAGCKDASSKQEAKADRTKEEPQTATGVRKRVER